MSSIVYILTGCTASGKNRVAVEAASRIGAEIVSVDSMKIYRRMDVGTAKPSLEMRRGITHHLIDVVEPSESFSLGRYVETAGEAAREISARGKPIVAVGGTMLYVQGLTAGVFEGPGADPEFRQALRERARCKGSQELHTELARVDPEAAGRIHPNDLRRIERALEVHHLTGRPISELQQQWGSGQAGFDCRLVAIRRPKEEASRRINARVRRMIDEGLVEEVRSLLAEPDGIGDQAAQAVGYAEIIAYLQGKMSLQEAVERIKINSRRLAKHQRTWMRRMPSITWIDVETDDTVEAVAGRVLAAWGV